MWFLLGKTSRGRLEYIHARRLVNEQWRMCQSFQGIQSQHVGDSMSWTSVACVALGETCFAFEVGAQDTRGTCTWDETHWVEPLRDDKKSRWLRGAPRLRPHPRHGEARTHSDHGEPTTSTPRDGLISRGRGRSALTVSTATPAKVLAVRHMVGFVVMRNCLRASCTRRPHGSFVSQVFARQRACF